MRWVPGAADALVLYRPPFPNPGRNSMSSIVESLGLEPHNLAGKGDKPSPQCHGASMDHFLNNTVTQLFEEQVARGPERLAVLSGNERLSYAALNAQANQLARYLRQRGVGPETLVGVCIDRSPNMAIGILGVLKAGAAYLPLDPDYPTERLTWVVKDSSVSFVLTKENLAAQFRQHKATVVLLDADAARIVQQPDENLADGPKPNDLAYVIYTSGSTGEPKGVMINHSSLANYVLALQVELDLNQNDRYLHTASIAFSSSRRQLLLPLSQGAAVVIASSEERKDPLALFEMIKQGGVTVMDAVPSFWRNCTTALLALDSESRRQLLGNGLRLMLSASEPLLSDVPNIWMHQFGHPASHVHMFGQTETAGIVCLYKIPAIETGKTHVVPIGHPIANSEIFILDEERQPAPAGTAGELYIGGAGVGRGYLHRPDLTAEKFIAHPFREKPGARLYRTGDWARQRGDGQIEFVGRRDSQMKLRGFRVELGEVEAVLARHGAVKENAVVAREDRSGTKRLAAYFVPRNLAPTVTELRTFLGAQLPDYMVPSTFVQLAALPLTANGKVNRRALPDPAEIRPELSTKYEFPQTATEKLLEKIWSEVLQLEKVGVEDNFFELGGHSLLAIQVIARINQQLRIMLPLRTFFDGPAIRKLANKIDSMVFGEGSSIPTLGRTSRDQEIPLSFAQQRLWFLDQLEPGSSLYNINRALRLRGALDVAKLERALQAIAARHEALRTTFVAPDGRPVQIIKPSVTVPFQLQDLRTLPSAAREEEAQRLVRIEAEKPFDLSRAPLLRVTTWQLAEEDHLLLLSIHHIISDAWAIKTFFHELATFYQNEGREESLTELRIQYPDFAHWQRSRLDGEVLEQQLAYWRNQLDGAPSSLKLPTDYPRPASPSFRGAQASIALPDRLSESLRDLSRREGVTLFMTLIGVFQILLGLYSGQDDVLLGIPVAGRSLIEMEGLIGCFVNTLVLRGDLSGNPTFRELIKRTREVALGAYTHQEIPFEKLVEKLRPERSLSRSPLFQVMFVLQDETKPDLSLPGLHVSSVPVESATAKFDFALSVIEKVDGLSVCLSFSTDLFNSASMPLMLEDFQLLLESIVANPAQHLSDLPALSWPRRARAIEKQHLATQERAEPEREFLAPRTPIEQRLAGIWTEILSVERVSIYDNFFELGGHSLLAAQVISRARNMFSVELPLRRLFETPTLAGLAEAIYEIQTAETGEQELAAILAELSQLTEEDAQLRFGRAPATP
ncbi:MAG: amino acid adenylation domain-containing protein [Acidobacteriota bacterium]|nr:amino acid adenylation domain-containing protein [Acidobacteriota bacterium]